MFGFSGRAFILASHSKSRLVTDLRLSRNAKLRVRVIVIAMIFPSSTATAQRTIDFNVRNMYDSGRH